MPMLETKDGMQKIEVGQTVGFKSDVEQYGRVSKIVGNILTLSNPNGFDGGYIGGDTVTTIRSDDCWTN